jgi:hypothetical protein
MRIAVVVAVRGMLGRRRMDAVVRGEGIGARVVAVVACSVLGEHQFLVPCAGAGLFAQLRQVVTPGMRLAGWVIHWLAIASAAGAVRCRVIEWPVSGIDAIDSGVVMA